MKRLGDLLATSPARTQALASRAIGGLALDSRKVAPGDVFFALAGAKDDGLKPTPPRRSARARRDRRRTRAATSPRAPFVRSPTRAPRLARAAARFYPRQPETIVAVTGTSGKTSVAAFVAPDLGGARPRGRFARHARRRFAADRPSTAR